MLGLLRYQVFLAYGAVFLAIWYHALAWRNEQSKDDVSLEVDLLVTWAPAWGIIALGVYALTQLVQGVINMSDCPEATKEIEQQVIEARAEMKKRGIQ